MLYKFPAIYQIYTLIYGSISDGPDRAILSPAQTSYTVNERSQFHKISCGSDCYPTCINTWRKQGESNSVPANNSWLDLGVLDKTEAGVYICNATNNQLSQSKTAQVSIFIRCKYLSEGLLEPEFYGDLVYKFKKLIGSNDFSFQFRKIITRYRRIGYNLNVMRQSACLVFNPITVDNYAAFNCTPVGRASDSMMAPT